MMKSLMKSVLRLRDSIRVLAPRAISGKRGIYMPDGSAVSVERIMKTYGVDRGTAEAVARRNAR